MATQPDSALNERLAASAEAKERPDGRGMPDDRADFYRITPLPSVTPSFAESIAFDVGYEIPEVTPVGPGCVEFHYGKYNLEIAVDKCTPEGHAEIKVWLGEGELTKALAWQDIRLLSQNSVGTLVKALQGKVEDVPWPDILQYCAWRAVQVARQGEPAEDIWPLDGDTLTPGYLLEPLLYLNHPTVVFGDYGSLKSLFALVTAYICQLPYYDNELGLTTVEESTRVLVLDWEDASDSFRRRLGAIERGFGQTMPILYHRMTHTLADSVDQLQRIISDRGVGLLIVDSLGPAARGNLNDPEPAIKYHAALRQLGITSLTLAHNSKEQLTKKRSIFGSIFFTNLARSVWECKSEQETGEDEAVISLKQQKANLSRLHPPLGYRFTFTDKTITIAKADLRETSLSGELSLSIRIKDLLSRGSLSVKQIAEGLDANEGSIKSAVNRLAKKGITVKVGDSWGLTLL